MSRSPRRLAGLALTSALLACTGGTSRAAPSQTPAQKHFGEAMRLFQRGEVASACRAFETSYDEEPAPGTLYNLALCHEKEGHLGQAYREFDELATRAEEQKLVDKAKAVRARADAIVPRLAIVHLIHRADARADISGLTLDDESLPMDSWRRPILVDPKAHVLVVQHTDGVAVTRPIDAIAAGQTLTIEMEDPSPVAPAPPLAGGLATTGAAGTSAAPPEATPQHQGLRRAAYVTGAVGGALLVAGGVAGIVALAKKSTLDTECPGGVCKTLGQGQADQRDARTPATLSTIGFIAGGGILATAVVLFLASPPGDDHASTSASRARLLPLVEAHLAGVGLSGTF
jgi:hypothetical protein